MQLFCRGALAVVCILTVCISISATCPADEPAQFFVAPGGHDKADGSQREPSPDGSHGPVTTIARAQQLVRAYRAKHANEGRPIHVMIAAGQYELGEPLVFTPSDSGSGAAPVVFQAEAGKRVIISGGKRINDWQVGSDKRWHAILDDVKAGRWSFIQLFVNGQRRYRPRLPQQGYYQVSAEASPTDEAAGKGSNRFTFKQGEIKSSWTNLRDAEILAAHQWSMSRLRIASVDDGASTVTLLGHSPSLEEYGRIIAGRRYFIDNVKEALSEPGQWYLDRASGELTYIPREGETPDNTEVIAPRLEQLLLIKGDPAGGKSVEHLHFQGLDFAYSNWITPETGQAISQAEINIPGAIAAEGARHCVFDGCAVRHTGGYAIELGQGCTENRIENCDLFDLSGGGVKIGSALDRMTPAADKPDDRLAAGYNIVRNCTIAHGGRLHSAAVGVWIGHSGHNKIESNDIYDLYYTGISVGWIWGYADSPAHHNEIALNHVHTIGQGVLSDMGGVYTLGVSPGTTVRDNIFHDVNAFDYGGWGLYTDEGSTGIVLQNNLVYRCKTGAFHQHYGRDNVVVSNILGFSTVHQLQRSRVESHSSFTFEKNIVIWDNDSPLMMGDWHRHVTLRNNLYWHFGREVKFPDGLSLDQWQTQRGQDQGSIVSDPKFIGATNDDFRLSPDSPAKRIGFQPFDYSRAGRHSKASYLEKAPAVPRAFP